MDKIKSQTKIIFPLQSTYDMLFKYVSSIIQKWLSNSRVTFISTKSKSLTKSHKTSFVISFTFSAVISNVFFSFVFFTSYKISRAADLSAARDFSYLILKRLTYYFLYFTILACSKSPFRRIPHYAAFFNHVCSFILNFWDGLLGCSGLLRRSFPASTKGVM